MKKPATSETSLTGFIHPTIADYPALRLRKIGKGRALLLDTENAFWAILKDDDSLEQEIAHKILPLYQKQKSALDREMRSFRHDVNLSAVYINATDRCNGRCQYCYIPEEMRTTGVNMKREDLYASLESIVDYFAKQPENVGRKPVVIYHGSEPLMVKSMIFESIEDFSDKIIFGLQTNATLMNQDDAAFLMKKRVSVGISFDSLDSLRNSELRPMVGEKNAYDAVMDALRWFSGYKGMNVVTTITNRNVSELPEIVRFLHQHGVMAALVNPIRCTFPQTASLRPDQDELYRYFKEAVDTAMNLTITTGKKIVVSSFANTILAIVAPVARRLMCDITPCGGGRRFFYILADTTTTPCGEFIPIERFRSPSIVDYPIETILHSKPFEEVRARTVENITACASCLYRHICGAPCPGEIHETDGTMAAPSPYCQFYQKIIDYAFELIADDKVKYLLRDEMTSQMESLYCL
jgi:uncharacterized protein